MKVRKTRKVVKEVEEVTESFIECDKCKEKIKKGFFDRFQCTFEYREGTVYPEGGSYEETSMDLCQHCGGELINVLESLGYRLSSEEVDI